MNQLYQQMNPMNLLQQLKSNPLQFLSERGAKLPQGLNDPNQIINHLMKTGQITQAQINKVANMARMFK